MCVCVSSSNLFECLYWSEREQDGSEEAAPGGAKSRAKTKEAVAAPWLNRLENHIMMNGGSIATTGGDAERQDPLLPTINIYFAASFCCESI